MIIEDGIGDYAIFISSEIQSTGFLFPHIPSKRVINYNLRNPDVLKQFVERITRCSHTYFQNCIKEWKRLDMYIYV